MNNLESIIKLTIKLCSFNSTEQNQQKRLDVLSFAIKWLKEHGVEGEYYEHKKAPSFVATLPGVGEPIIVLAHLDVVPASDHMFEVRQESNKLMGRGVLDDKGPASILMHLMAHVATLEHHPTLQLVLTTDEEVGSPDGVRRLVEDVDLFTQPKFVLALDGGSQQRVVIAEKGVAHMMVEATGTEYHNSRPWNGDNAIEKLYKSYQNMKEVLLTNQDAPNHWHTSVSIGTIEGGKFTNQVPGSAKAGIDIRFTEKYTSAEIKTIVEKCLEEGVTITKFGGGEAFVSNEDDATIQAYKKAMEISSGQPVELVHEHGATDGRFFKKYGCPIVLQDPDGGGMHTDEEWVDTSSMQKIYQGLVNFIETV